MSLEKESYMRFGSQRLLTVLKHFKVSPEYYSSDLSLIAKLFFFMKDVNFTEESADQLENQIYKKYDKLSSDELVQFTTLCNSVLRPALIKYIFENCEKFSPEQLTTVASYSYKDEKLVELQKNQKFKLRDLFISKKVVLLSSNPFILLELTKQLVGMIQNENDLEKFLEILIEIEKKDIHLAQNLVDYLEQKLLNSDLKLNFTAIKLILRILKSKGLHLSFSSNFYKHYISLITIEITRKKCDRPSFYLSLFGKEHFSVDSLFEILVTNFKKEVVKSKRYWDTLSGFEGCSVSIFFDQELIDLFHSFISLNLKKFNQNELIRVLKIFINQGLYFESMLDLVLDQLFSLDLEKILLADQNFLEDNLELIAIDLPEKKEKLQKFEKMLTKKRSPRKFEISNTQHYVAQVLVSSNISFTPNQILGKVYEVDFLLADKTTIIEVIGTLFHFNVFSKKLSPKTMVKLRHLSKLGYKTILTIGKESTENHLKKAIFFLNNFKNFYAVLLLENEIQVIDTIQQLRKN